MSTPAGSDLSGTFHTKGVPASSSVAVSGVRPIPLWPTEGERDEYEIYLAVKVLRAHAPHLLSPTADEILPTPTEDGISFNDGDEGNV